MDPVLTADQPAAPGGAPAASAPPAAPEAANPATSPAGEPTTQAFKPAYESQLSKRLQSPEIYAKLATTGGPNLDHLADAYLKSTEELTKLKASEEALKARTALPGKDAKEEDWNPIWETLGWPKDKAEYKFDRSGELKDLPQLPGLDEKLAEIFHRLKVPKTMAEGFFKEQSKLTLEMLKGVRAEREAQAAAGKKDFEKLAGRGYDEAVADLEQTAKTFFGEEDWKTFLTTPLANRAGFMFKLIGLKKAMSDSPIVTGGGATGQTEPKTAREALKQALS